MQEVQCRNGSIIAQKTTFLGVTACLRRGSPQPKQASLKSPTRPAKSDFMLVGVN